MNRVKVSLNAAAEFAAQGYGVECFVVSGPSQQKKGDSKRRFEGSQMCSDSLLTISLEGKNPAHGALAVAWKRVRKEIWERDATRIVTRKFLVEALGKEGLTPANANTSASSLVYHYKCLRRVEEG